MTERKGQKSNATTMNRTLLNLLIDIAAASLFLAMIVTGYILRFPLPPGTNKIATLWSLTRHEWGTIHSWISFALLSVILVHIVLHWQWIVSVIDKRLHLASKAHPRLLPSGLIALSILGVAIGLFAWTAQQSVKAITEDIPGVCPPDDHSDSDAGVGSFQSEKVEPQLALWTVAEAILSKNCLSCHGPSRQLGNFRVDRHDDFFKADSPLVVPGKSSESPLIEIVSGSRTDMKLAERHKLPAEELTQIKAWIDAGAAWPASPGFEH